MSENKHAYLIMAHSNFTQLQQLIHLLDHPRNDIYLHVDKKATDFSKDQITTQYSELHFIPRIRVTWSGHSQIQCEVRLLNAAAPRHYRYYHLISGMDLPTKTQDQIHRFFDSHPNRNYFNIDPVRSIAESASYRIGTYHFLQNIIGKSDTMWLRRCSGIEQKLLAVQKKLGIRRKLIIPYYKGGNWFSISDDFAQYVLSQQKLIRKQFYYSICADEVFLQCLIMASPYRDTLVNNCLREIDWERGCPYTFRMEDVDAVLASPNLFARKFDMQVDEAAVQAMIQRLSADQDA